MNGTVALAARLKAALPLAQRRGIYGKINREILALPPRPPPFPYERKKVGLLRSLVDHTLYRMDANSKVVVVDAPPAVGKTALARQLADDLDMKHYPEVTLDDYYVNPYGFDLRRLDGELPPDARSYDHADFCRDPKHRHAARFQLMMFGLRYSQYFDALAHVFNTGQGVVLERSPYSDFVFLDAMFQCGFVRKPVKSVYYEIKGLTIQELLKPHLAIYLDAPVSAVKRRIAERNLAHERDSPALTDEFLQAVERNYKEHYLKEVSKHSEVLVYDWTEPGDTDVVIEDVERIDFDHYNSQSPKMKDWEFNTEQEASDERRKFTNLKSFVMEYFDVFAFDVPELTISGYDDFCRDKVYTAAPGMKYEYGFNPAMGDGSWWTRIRGPKHTTIEY